jgi:hypothetical protein
MDIEAQRDVARVTSALLLVFIFAVAAAGQDPQITQVNAPPPFRAIPKQERSQIEQNTDSGKRLRLTIEFATSHLTLAENYTNQQNYEAASAEVGMYYALLQNALTYMSELKRDSNRTRDLYKKLELILRQHGPRLTTMRRITPIEFAVWIKEAEDYAREGRTEALNSFYGHTVVREPKPTNPEKRADKPKEEPDYKNKTP